MLFVNGSNSVRLNDERIKGLKLHTRDKFTIEEAVLYWADIAQIGSDDSDAMFDYKTILDMFYDAYKEERLELCYCHKFVSDIGSGIVRICADYVFTLSGVEYEFRPSEVNRRALIKLARDVGKSPLPLFLKKGMKENVADYGNSDRDSKAASKEMRFIDAVKSLLNKQEANLLSRYFEDGKFHNSAIVRELENQNKLEYDFDSGRNVFKKCIDEKKIKQPKRGENFKLIF